MKALCVLLTNQIDDLPKDFIVDLGVDSLGLSYAGFWVIRPDQAARFSVSASATPSVNVAPSMTIGNWFAPFRRCHVFAAA